MKTLEELADMNTSYAWDYLEAQPIEELKKMVELSKVIYINRIMEERLDLVIRRLK